MVLRQPHPHHGWRLASLLDLRRTEHLPSVNIHTTGTGLNRFRLP